MTTRMAEGALYDLLSWMSPSYPIGAFAYSSGLEWAVETGHVRNRTSAQGWIADLIAHGSIRTDMILFVHAYRAAAAGDGARLREVGALAAAMLTSRERHLESTAQGAAFRRTAQATSPTDSLALLDPIDDEALAYPVAAACLMAGHGVTLESALTAWLHGSIANLVSAAQRLVPLGQTDGQLLIRALREPCFAAVAEAAALADEDPFEQMGSAALHADLASMAHETQYTRLFRT